ncbi:MAG: TIR domain-containing protein [Pyrinomonadaceae bacterium]
MRNTVFISYSHSDAKWLEMLKDQLAPYKDAGSLTYWADTEIEAGDKWLEKIQTALASAKVAVLLVSPKFLTSDFIKHEEIPPLLDAAEKDGLRIIWIALSHCGYKRTWLKDYQAANTPERTLDMLEPWEQNKVLKEVCEKIEKAASGVPHSTGVTPQHYASTPYEMQRAKTGYEIKRCNRTKYLNSFGSFFHGALKTRAGLPHVYVIHGDLRENHKSFTDRMYHEVFKTVDGAESSTAQSQGMHRNQRDLKWPTQPAEADDTAEALKGMREELQQELSVNLLRQHMSDLPSTTLADRLPKHRYFILEHAATLERFSDFSTELFDWYLNKYWAELAQAGAPDTGARPQLFCLIKILYPEPGFFGSLFGFHPRLMSPGKKNIQKALREFTERANNVYPCLLLDELQTPSVNDVSHWYRDNEIYDNEYDCRKAAEQVFKGRARKIRMYDIEKHLYEVYDKKRGGGSD